MLFILQLQFKMLLPLQCSDNILMNLQSSTHYNTAPPMSTSLPSRGFSPCSYLGCFSGGRGTPGPPSTFLHLQPLVATSATAAATAVGGQRLNWPGSQQVDEGEQRLNWPGSLAGCGAALHLLW